MPDPNLNAWWCRGLAEELRRAGVERAVLCPGSRNSPLLFALDAALPGATTVHWDERGAGFLALGMARASGRPVAVCVTSGTAAANLLPACCEAAAAGLTLVLITADRPWEAQGCGAPQAMPQRGLFGGFAEAVDLGEPVPEPRVLRQARARLCRAIALAERPVHLNVPLRDPLPPLPAAGWTAPADPSPPALPARPRRAGGVPSVPPARRGLIIAGPEPTIAPELVARLAEATGMPVLCDAASGLRRPMVPGCVGSFDALLGEDRPDAIVRIGPPPLTRVAYEWMARQSCPQIVLGRGAAADHTASADHEVVSPDAAAIDDLARGFGRCDAAWRESWLGREARARACLPPAGWDATAATALACAHRGFGLLWLASSMPVRDANLCLAPRQEPQLVLCNRGVNGIDGTIASFIGAAAHAARPGLCLIGDLAALHDLNSLALAPLARGAVVVLNNRGGAIFDALPVAQVPGYRRLVRTGHDLDFAHAAGQFGLPYRRCTDQSGLGEALDVAATGDRLMLIECDLGDSDGIAAHRRLVAMMRG